MNSKFEFKQTKSNALAWMQQTESHLFNLEKQTMFFLLYYIPIKKINVGKSLKLRKIVV
jgi:hypothetical protein